MLEGRLEQPVLIANALDCSNRARTLVLDRQDDDPTRHTLVTPLRYLGSSRASAQAITLARVEIQRGARHQIRAHLASAGFPLWGDPVYNPGSIIGITGGGQLYLHHAGILFPGFSAATLPEWQWEGERLILETGDP